MLESIEHKHLLPIIYVRGYAMTEAERNETAADPFCGFNSGSTVFRASADKNQGGNKFVFESPVLRLASDFGYRDVYENGFDIVDSNWPASNASADARRLGRQSVVVFRYYDEGSTLLGDGHVAPITDFALRLGRLILLVRDLVCANPANGLSAKTFGCYLVAHSMGGLVCRTLLQNPALGSESDRADMRTARACVDKVFTYATPHNGIEVAGLNVPRLPDWIPDADASNFNRGHMARYLALESLLEKTGRVDWLPESAFPVSRFFSLVGTNRADYEVARGLSRAFAGHGSDGLVKIDNASVWGADDAGEFTQPCATAYVYRAHSGPYGIVNSEDAYQNLVRFLFGDLRVDVWADIYRVKLPPAVQKQARGKTVQALYQFGITAAPRGKRWFLTRRVAEEDSVACRTHQQLAQASREQPQSVFLSTLFLARHGRVNRQRDSLAYGVQFEIGVPDYEIDRRLWMDTHYEGAALFRGSLVVEIFPSEDAATDPAWDVRYDWQQPGTLPGTAKHKARVRVDEQGRASLSLVLPGDGLLIEGALRFEVSSWNHWRRSG